MKPDIKKKLSVSNPKKISDLHLENGRLKKLPSELKEFTKLKFLNLFNNRLDELPDFFAEMNSITTLNLSNNNFVLFPEQITKLNKLKSLNLTGNRINDLIGIDSLSNSINKLNLSSNKLDVLRIDFSSFDKLIDIDISNNKVKKFPKSLLLSHIKKLNLSGNQIDKLPNEINKLSKVNYLDLSFNNISELPEEICELTELRTLNLIGNNISKLPKSLKKLKKLQTLNLNGNPIGEVPIEIANQGLNAVLNYYLHLGSSVRLNEAKLLIVGQGDVGKTYLMNKLVTGETPTTKSTEGIEILKWFLDINSKDNKKEKIRLNAWDFGGQEIYHSTHQFFLTNRSLYLFIWEARKDDTLLSFDYWLNIIKVLSNSSPVIIVLNKIDERIKEIDEKSLKEKFPNIKSFQSVSAIEGTNIEVLEESIKKNVIQLPHIGDKLPEVWSQIRDKLEDLTEDYITYDKYIEICNSFGLDKRDAKHISNYYHDLGVFLHFHDNNILKPIVFLKPEWVTNCVYRILDLKHVVKKYGEFDLAILEQELTSYSHEQICYIVELMKKFELCFEIKNDTYIIPELLRSSPGDNFNLKLSNDIGLVYKYDFMPAGILPRLTVRLKDLIHEKQFWKNGALLKFEKDKGDAVIISNQFTRSIKINASGQKRAVLLGIIKRELDYINSTLNYPYHEMKIECNCTHCKNSDDPFMFDYEYLEKAKEKGIEMVQCQYNIIDVDLMSLIGPYEITTKQFKEEVRFNSDELVYDIIEISSRLLERKYTVKSEDLTTDNFTDQLRAKGYRVSDQTRSGKSKVASGELDIMIRNQRNMPIAILEAMRLNSFGPGNKTIIEHLNKMLLDYDTNGLKRNYMLIYAKTDDFSNYWLKYVEYIEKLPHHHLYDTNAKLISFNDSPGLSHISNLKILISQHQRDNGICEVYHFVMKLS